MFNTDLEAYYNNLDSFQTSKHCLKIEEKL